MKENVFDREDKVIRKARSLLTGGSFQQDGSEDSYRELLAEYEKSVRQSKRLLKMGDRMQLALASLNEELQLREQKYRGIFENAIEGIYYTDAQGVLLEVNTAMACMLGYETTEECLKNTRDVGDIFKTSQAFSQYKIMLHSKQVVKSMHAQLCCADGNTVWAEINAGAIESHATDNRHIAGIVGVIADITERKHMMREMCRLARTDCLTGLWNRGYFVELAAQEIARCKRFSHELSILLVDVDYFKGVNDKYGHDIGDKVLVGVADTLRETLREVDVVARFGGEEFVVMLPDTGLDAAQMAADRLCRAVREQDFSYDRHRAINVTVSIGVTAFEDVQTSLDLLLKRADTAMYAAKHNGRDRVEFCTQCSSR
ncbi:sensor domain-containing diguanylate cyclase [Halodesulfovibrio spirochaetisodalis]|uniref:sensor domain-containing diguanylate cyclase n=1 Tax=Halodesulfovibrio spirochaetisodalis TaxID=1560234 RepID=UPI00082C3AFC|nr:sensor domain-containing diguanylate cyclase [Halodesulfovibrio spirochaetisodalis]